MIGEAVTVVAVLEQGPERSGHVTEATYGPSRRGVPHLNLELLAWRCSTIDSLDTGLQLRS